jgi:hypothetical protein
VAARPTGNEFMNTTYRHTQRGTVIVITMLVMSLLFAALGWFVFRALLIAVPILLVAGWLFHSLTIEVTNRELRWRFGPGWIRHSVPLSEIASTQPVVTNLIEGWGIHYSRFGWLYNVSGRGAVAFTSRNGKQFALGTDEPAELVKAVNAPMDVPGETLR